MTGRFTGLAVLLAALAAAPAADAASFTVNDAGDASDATPGDNVCATAGAVCTLRAALDEAAANADAEDAIGFAVPEIAVPTALTLSGRVTITGPVTLRGTGAGFGTVLAVGAGGAGSTIRSLTIRDAARGVDLGGTAAVITQTAIFNVTFPIAGSTLAAPQAFRIGPRRADGSLPITGSTNGGTVELFSGNPTGPGPVGFIGGFAAPPGGFENIQVPEPAPGSVYSSTVTSGGATSAFATATTPDDVASPSLVGAVATSTKQVRVQASEPLDPASVQPGDFLLEMAGEPRAVTGLTLDPTGTAITLDSGGWTHGEAGFVQLAAPGALADAAGNASLGTPRLRVAAAPGDFLAPVGSSLAIRPRKICLTRSRACRRTGATVKFISSEGGRARLVILRGNRRVGEDVALAQVGRNAIRFNGRLRGRKLRAGPYRMLLYLEDAVGNVTIEPPIQRFEVRRVR